MAHYEFMAKTILMVLLIGASQLSAATVQDCRDLFSLEQEVDELLALTQLSSDPAREEEFRDLLDFEKRVFKFLKDAPEDVLATIGANFGLSGPLDKAEKESTFQTQDLETSRRETILRYTRAGMLDADWEIVSQYYADPELYRFLATALTALPAGTNQIKKSILPDQIRMYALTYMMKYEKQMPSPEIMLKTSRLMRDGFFKAARIKDKKFNLDLSLAKNQDAALKMLYEKKFGNLRSFLVLWLTEATCFWARYNKESFGPAKAFLARKVEDQVKDLLEKREEYMAFNETSTATFFNRFLAFFYYNNPTYSKEEVRKALNEALQEHHDLLKVLMAESRQLDLNDSTKFEYVHRFEYEAPKREKVQTEVDNERLESFIDEKLPIDQLQPERDYKISFTREFGLRRKVFTVRFTARALAELREWQIKRFHGVPAIKWLKALQLGPASANKQNGIKLLKASPIKAMPHLELEIKIVGPGERWLGYIDEQGRYVFDLFHNDHA